MARKPSPSAPAAKVAKRAAPKRSPGKKVVARKRRGAAAPRAVIRMYRQGLGDSFLLSINRDGGQPYRVMIDCGVIIGTEDAAKKMTAVIDDIAAVTGGRIDLLLLTHQHWDHLSGFIQAEEALAKLDVGAVWVAWTEDPDDALAQELRGERETALASLRLAGAALTAMGAGTELEELDGITSFFGAAGGATTQQALDKAMSLVSAGALTYVGPHSVPFDVPDTSARIYVMGPPHDAKQIRRTLPSKREPETYGVAANQFSADVASALMETDNSAPFDPIHAIPIETARTVPFFRTRYWGPGDAAPGWRMIDATWLSGATELALALDSATNNTSLVVAVELDDDDVLLFAADAQVGNWLSWQDLSWKVGGRDVTGPDLLQRTLFYKVGHHGSHNATLREKGLELMSRLKLAAIPVDKDMAVKKRWTEMPLNELVEALEAKASNGVLRSDRSPKAPIPNVTVKGLYFEITIP